MISSNCRLTSMFVGAFILSFAVSLHSADKYMQGSLTPGPHSVGFKVEHVYDYGRSFKPNYDDDMRIIRRENPRPMQIAIWYPASGGGTAMTFRDYVHLDGTRDNFHELSVDEKKQLDENFINQRSFLGQAKKDLMRATLTLKSTAKMNANTKSGKFPLVLYAPRESRGAYLNTVLCEYLASNGYVVACTPNKWVSDRQNRRPAAEDVMSNVQDLQFVKGFMRELANVDRDRVATAGWAHGAVPAATLAMVEPQIRAVISLDGNFADGAAPQIMKGLGNFRPRNITVPLLHVKPGEDFRGQPNTSDHAFWNNLLYSDAAQLTLTGVRWISLSSYFNLSMAKPVDDDEQYHYARIDYAYDSVCRYAVNFLNAHLKDDATARKFLGRSPEENGFEKGALGFVSRKALPVPLTETQLMTIIDSKGFEAGKAAVDLAKKNDADHVMFTSNGMNNFGYTMMGKERFDEAVGIFKMILEQYPGDPNVTDSLGEAYMNVGKKQLAIQTYKRVLKMDASQGTKDNSIKMLKQLGVDIERDGTN